MLSFLGLFVAIGTAFAVAIAVILVIRVREGIVIIVTLLAVLVAVPVAILIAFCLADFVTDGNAFIGAFVAFTFAIRMPMLAILPLMLLGLVLYFWKIFNCELEYSMVSGQMTFSRIYGGMKRKKILEVTIKDFREVAPRTTESEADLKSKGIVKTYSFSSHSTARDQYYALFEQDGTLCVVYFEATEKTLKLLRYYNPVTVVTKVSR